MVIGESTTPTTPRRCREETRILGRSLLPAGKSSSRCSPSRTWSTPTACSPTSSTTPPRSSATASCRDPYRAHRRLRDRRLPRRRPRRPDRPSVAHHRFTATHVGRPERRRLRTAPRAHRPDQLPRRVPTRHQSRHPRHVRRRPPPRRPLRRDDVPDLVRKAIAVDPAVTDTDRSDSHGCQCDGIDTNGTIFRLRSWEQRATPDALKCDEWAYEDVSKVYIEMAGADM